MNLFLNEDYTVRIVTEFCRKYDGADCLDEAEKVVKMMNDVFSLEQQAEEYVYLIALTGSCKPIGIFEIAHGNCTGAVVGIREIMIRALLCGAVHIMLVHNHPGGHFGTFRSRHFDNKKIIESVRYHRGTTD